MGGSKGATFSSFAFLSVGAEVAPRPAAEYVEDCDPENCMTSSNEANAAASNAHGATFLQRGVSGSGGRVPPSGATELPFGCAGGAPASPKLRPQVMRVRCPASCNSSRPSSRMSAKRCAGSRLMARVMMRTKRFDRLGLYVCGGTYCPAPINRMSSGKLEALNGARAVAHSYINTPSEYWSDSGVISSPRKPSGDM